MRRTIIAIAVPFASAADNLLLTHVHFDYNHGYISNSFIPSGGIL